MVEDQIFVDFVGFLSILIYEVLYTRCLRYNTCCAWFLDIRISTCFFSPSQPGTMLSAALDGDAADV